MQPILHPDTTLLLPPRLMGRVGYYAAMIKYGKVIVDTSMRYDKRIKDVHRYDIADVRGTVQLTVPESHPDRTSLPHPLQWDDCSVSSHDEWWRRHRTTLESAYGRTPFFEYLIDKFDCVLCDPCTDGIRTPLMELDRRADAVIRGILGLENRVEWIPCPQNMEGDIRDMRRDSFMLSDMPPYWQIRANTLGFMPNMSVLDLIFNTGPEAARYLVEMS